MRTFLVAILLFAASSADAQQVAPAPKFIRENSPVIALTHVQLIDGTGAAAQADQTIVIDHGKIAAVGSAASTNVPAGAKVIDAKGKTVTPAWLECTSICFTQRPMTETRFSSSSRSLFRSFISRAA